MLVVFIGNTLFSGFSIGTKPVFGGLIPLSASKVCTAGQNPSAFAKPTADRHSVQEFESARDLHIFMNEPILGSKPTLREYQDYLKTVVKVRGFDNETVTETFLLFLEECGELAKAVRKSSGIKSGSHSVIHNASEEAADVFIYLLEICNLLGIDMETAFRDKEEKNKKRSWS